MPGRRHDDFEAAVVQEVDDLHEHALRSTKKAGDVPVDEGLGQDVTLRAGPAQRGGVIEDGGNGCLSQKLKASGGASQLQRPKCTAVHGPSMPQ